jgi:4-hydroxy-4-methyl-2-oxoglutarate aldolase
MIDEPPLLTIRRDIPRADPALVAALSGAMTGHVVDALDGGGAMGPRVKPLDPDRAAFVGCALPCWSGPADNLATAAAIALARPGDVIVAAAEGFVGIAVMGDNIAMMARNAGVAALVTDGAVRDVAGIRDVGLPLFAAGVTPNSGVRSGPGTVGLPVVCGGVAVAPGDVLVGDSDGVVVIPGARLAEVVARLDQIRAAERVLQARLAEGLTRLDSTAALLASDRVRWV